jgi:hypothetical protein
MIKNLELPNEEVLFRLVVAESDVDCPNLRCRMASRDVQMGDDVLRMAVEGKVVSNEGQGTSCPFTRVDRAENGIVFDAFAETRLAVLA